MVIPLGTPLIVPTVQAVWVVPTNPNILTFIELATALPLLVALNVWFSLPNWITVADLPFNSSTVGSHAVAFVPSSIFKFLKVWDTPVPEAKPVKYTSWPVLAGKVE